MMFFLECVRKIVVVDWRLVLAKGEEGFEVGG